MKKNTFLKVMLALGCAATVGVASMQAQAYVYRSYGYHGGRYYYTNRPVYHRSYYYSRPYYRYNYRSYYNAGNCGFWRHGVWIRTRCY